MYGGHAGAFAGAGTSIYLVNVIFGVEADRDVTCPCLPNLRASSGPQQQLDEAPRDDMAMIEVSPVIEVTLGEDDPAIVNTVSALADEDTQALHQPPLSSAATPNVPVSVAEAPPVQAATTKPELVVWSDERVDQRLYEGAAAAGWRVVEAWPGGAAKCNWKYVSPAGEQYTSAQRALRGTRAVEGPGRGQRADAAGASLPAAWPAERIEQRLGAGAAALGWRVED